VSRLVALFVMLLPVGALAQVASQKQLPPGTLPHDCMLVGECGPQNDQMGISTAPNVIYFDGCPVYDNEGHLHFESCKPAKKPAPKEDRSWHALTITYGGTVSLLKGLTKHEADYTCDRAMGRPATRAEKEAAARFEKEQLQKCAAEKAGRRKPSLLTGSACINQSESAYVSEGDIKSCEVFQ